MLFFGDPYARRSATGPGLPKGATLVETHPSEPASLYAGVHDGTTVQVVVSRGGGKGWSPP